MRVLVACEFSAVVREAFTKHGHDAWSCDILPSEGSQGKHIHGDVLPILERGWDLMIAHPPCRYLSLAGNVWINRPGRKEKREEALTFFLTLATAPILRIAVENPKGYPARAWRKPDQIIQPYEFGHAAHKPTCLWLKNLPLLRATNVVNFEPRIDGVTGRNRHWVDQFPGGNLEKRRRERSRTFQGIADAMAEQWG